MEKEGPLVFVFPRRLRACGSQQLLFLIYLLTFSRICFFFLLALRFVGVFLLDTVARVCVPVWPVPRAA